MGAVLLLSSGLFTGCSSPSARQTLTDFYVAHGGAACEGRTSSSVSAPNFRFTSSSLTVSGVAVDEHVQARQFREESTCNGRSLIEEPNVSRTTTGFTLQQNTSTSLFSYGACDPTAAGSGCEDPDACSGTYGADIYDSALVGIEGGCEELDGHAEIYLAWADGKSTPAGAPPPTDCVSGSGRFKLWPYLMQDFDRDGSSSAVLAPMMVDGTGVMTGRSWISQISVINKPEGSSLRVIKPLVQFQFDGDDRLSNPAMSGYLLTASHSFSGGQLVGNPQFVFDEVDPGSLGTVEVDVSWTCDLAMPVVSAPLAWKLKVADLSCSGLGEQLYSFRYDALHSRVSFGLYGSPYLQVYADAQSTVDGSAFTFEFNGAVVDGVILSYSTEQATVRLDEVSYMGLPVCATGTYTLPGE